MDAILATYPLSAGFQERLTTLVDPASIRLSLSELRTLPNVLLGAHNGSNTREGVARASSVAVDFLLEELST